MSDNNIIEFPKKPDQTEIILDEGPLINFTFTDSEGNTFTFNPETDYSLLLQDTKLDYMCEAMFELQVEVESNPDLAEYVTAQIERLLRTIRNNKPENQ